MNPGDLLLIACHGSHWDWYGYLLGATKHHYERYPTLGYCGCHWHWCNHFVTGHTDYCHFLFLYVGLPEISGFVSRNDEKNTSLTLLIHIEGTDYKLPMSYGEY